MRILTGVMNYKPQIRSLWKTAFSESDIFLDWYFNKQWNGDNAIAVFDENRLVAALEMVKYKLSMRGSFIDCSYIVGVSVETDMRKRGIATKIMRESIYNARNDGEILSLLTPFSYAFYRKMGYELCYSHIRSKYKKRDIKTIQRQVDVKQLSEQNIKHIDHVYNSFIKSNNGFALRSERDWGYVFGTTKMNDGGVFGVYEGNNLTGYATLYKFNGEHRIGEIAYFNLNSFESLFSYAFSGLKDDDNLVVDLPEYMRSSFLVSEPDEIILKPTVMARVINVRKAIEQLKLKSNLSLKINDTFIPENSGIYSLNGDTSSGFDFELDIGAFTQIYTGYTDPAELYSLGYIKGKKEKIVELCECFPMRRNYIYHIMSNEL